MIGQSAGRSSGNRNGQGARRRFTQRERDLVDPPWDPEPEPERYRLTPRGEKLYTAGAWFSVLVLYSLIVFFVGMLAGIWFEPL